MKTKPQGKKTLDNPSKLKYGKIIRGEKYYLWQLHIKELIALVLKMNFKVELNSCSH